MAQGNRHTTLHIDIGAGLGIVIALCALGQAPPAEKPAYLVLPHPDSQLAHELFRLRQVDPIKAELAAAAGTDREPLWKAQLIAVEWDDQKKNSGLSQAYIAALTTYLKTQAGGINGAWALDHAQFILSKLSQPIITRMEYFANNPKDRKLLEPLAAFAGVLLKQAGISLDAQLKLLESRKPFDEASYMRSYGAAAEVKYYDAWAQYFNAMAMDPAAPERLKILETAAAALGEWAVDEPDNGVNFQAYLLRGKILAEARNFPKAQADFAKAQNDKAPAWVQYQGRYQTIVLNLRQRDFRAADTNLNAFKRWIPKDNVEAKLSADMLGYRVAWALAESKTSDFEKKTARTTALAILDDIIERDPRFKDLVYEQLAASIHDNTDPSTLLPMQQIALAYFNSQWGGGQKGDTPESRQQLKLAIDAALAARRNPASSKAQRVEGTYLAAACNAVLNNLPEAVKYSIEFAEQSPGDPRARQMVELALQQIGELRKIAGAQGLSPDLKALAESALHLSADTFGDTRWRYAQARMFEDSGKLREAAAVYEKIPQDDRNYLDARYRLVNLATSHFAQLPAATSEADMRAAAQNVFNACTNFIALLDHPPESAPKDVLERAKTYRYDIWIIEAATALNPAVKQTDVALDRLGKLDQTKASLADNQKGAVLRYRILAYQMTGQADKAFAVVEEYAKANGQDAMGVIRSMALSTVDEINRVEPTDPAEAKRLAAYVVKLLDPIIATETKQGKKDNAFEYHLIQADMMVRAGQFKDAQKLAVTLQEEKKEDLRPYITEARGIFAEAQSTNDAKTYARSQDYFQRILARLADGSESYWEAWLRILQSMEARGTDAAATAEIKKSLRDLKGIHPTKFGGELLRHDFEQMASKYGV